MCCCSPNLGLVVPTMSLGGHGTANMTGNIIPAEMAVISTPWGEDGAQALRVPGGVPALPADAAFRLFGDQPGAGEVADARGRPAGRAAAAAVVGARPGRARPGPRHRARAGARPALRLPDRRGESRRSELRARRPRHRRGERHRRCDGAAAGRAGHGAGADHPRQRRGAGAERGGGARARGRGGDACSPTSPRRAGPARWWPRRGRPSGGSTSWSATPARRRRRGSGSSARRSSTGRSRSTPGRSSSWSRRPVRIWSVGLGARGRDLVLHRQRHRHQRRDLPGDGRRQGRDRDAGPDARVPARAARGHRQLRRPGLHAEGRRATPPSAPAAWEAAAAATPSGRIAEPEDVAAAVAFFLSREACHITGQILRVDGGLSL